MDPAVVALSHQLLINMKKHDVIVTQIRTFDKELESLERKMAESSSKGDNLLALRKAVVHEKKQTFESCLESLNKEIQLISSRVVNYLQPGSTHASISVGNTTSTGNNNNMDILSTSCDFFSELDTSRYF